MKGATSTGIALALAVLPVAAYRWFLQQHVPAELSNPELNHEYFLASENVTYTLKIIARMLWMGWFMAFKLFWAIPLLAVLACWRSGRRLQAGWFVLVVGGAAGQLVLAHDTSRLLGLAFPAILWGAIVLREQVLGEQGSTKQGSAKQGSANLFTKALWLGIGFNFLVPQYYIGQDIAIPFLPSPVSLVMWLCGVYPWDLWWAG